MKVDRAGNLFATGPGGVHVFAPDGTHLGHARHRRGHRQLRLGRRRLDPLHHRRHVPLPRQVEYQRTRFLRRKRIQSREAGEYSMRTALSVAAALVLWTGAASLARAQASPKSRQAAGVEPNAAERTDRKARRQPGPQDREERSGDR